MAGVCGGGREVRGWGNVLRALRVPSRWDGVPEGKGRWVGECLRSGPGLCCGLGCFLPAWRRVGPGRPGAASFGCVCVWGGGRLGREELLSSLSPRHFGSLLTSGQAWVKSSVQTGRCGVVCFGVFGGFLPSGGSGRSGRGEKEIVFCVGTDFSGHSGQHPQGLPR